MQKATPQMIEQWKTVYEEYKSKLKLFCHEIKVEKLAYIKDNNYLCNQERKPTIKIVEL